MERKHGTWSTGPGALSPVNFLELERGGEIERVRVASPPVSRLRRYQPALTGISMEHSCPSRSRINIPLEFPCRLQLIDGTRPEGRSCFASYILWKTSSHFFLPRRNIYACNLLVCNLKTVA